MTGADIVADLNLLLTAKRLNSNSTAVITSYVDSRLAANGDVNEAISLAQQLFVATAEFHSTNLQALSSRPRAVNTGSGVRAGNFKAIVVLFQAGGCDSYNVLVPFADCAAAGKDMFAHYEAVRRREADTQRA